MRRLPIIHAIDCNSNRFDVDETAFNPETLGLKSETSRYSCCGACSA